MTPLACASPIYTPQAETQTNSLRSASPAVANEMELGGVTGDLHTWLSGIPRTVLTDPTLRIFATLPADGATPRDGRRCPQPYFRPSHERTMSIAIAAETEVTQ
jgi:hypothetical protein